MGGPPGGLNVVQSPSWTVRDSWRVSRLLLDILEGFPTSPGHPEGPPNHSRTSGKASR